MDVFNKLFLPNKGEELYSRALNILSKWYKEELSLYKDDKLKLLQIVKDTLHDKIMNCKSLEDRNTIWKVIDENTINLEYRDELEESNLAYKLNDDFDERWDKEFGQYMNGIQVMKAADAINLLKRMERFK